MRALRKKTISDIIFEFCNYIFMILFAVTIIYPFWNMFLLSFSNAQEVTSLGFRIWINKWDLKSYGYLFEHTSIFVAYQNTIFRTVIGTILTISITTMAAYSLSKKNLPGRNFITIFYLIPMFFGGGLIPTYILIRSLGLINSLWVLIIPGIVSSFNLIIMRNFLMTISQELEESAFIDGASYFKILWKIIIPLSKPVIATITLWTAVAHWNAWFDALIYISDEKKIVLQLLLRRMIRMTDRDLQTLMQRIMEDSLVVHTSTVIAATTFVTIGPVIILYPFLQKYFVKGIMIGSLKG